MTRFVELGPGSISFAEAPPAALAPGTARVAVTACGLCGTDLHLYEGMTLPPGASYPVRPGHEVAGAVVETTDDLMPVGTPVVLHPLAPCGQCATCANGQPEFCASQRILGVHLPGGLATEVVWPTSRMVAVPGLDPRQAAVLADAVATAKRALDTARVPSGGRLCVLGAGGVGTHVLQLARLRDPDARLVGAVHSAASANRLRDAGYEAVLGLEAATLRPLGPFDAVIDFSGDPAAPAVAVKLLRPQGVFVFGSVLDGDLVLGVAQRIQVRELVVAGVYSSSMDDLRAVAQLAVSGVLDLSASITHEFALAEAEAAFRTLQARPAGMLRVIVNVGSGR